VGDDCAVRRPAAGGRFATRSDTRYSLLWAFNIKNAVDKSGKPLPIDIFSL
jgi:hypothetical protein